MADEWLQQMKVASWGGFVLDVMNVSDSYPRAQVTHEYPFTDGGQIEDLGANPRVSSLRIIFFGLQHLNAFKLFKALYDEGEAKEFVHPLFGKYSARASGLTSDVQQEPRDFVDCNITFTEDTTEPAVFDIGELRTQTPSEFDVNQRSEDVTTELAAQTPPATSTAPAIADSTVAAWELDINTGRLNARRIALEAGKVRNTIQSEMTRLELTAADTYLSYIAFNALLESVRITANAYLAQTPKLTTITVIEAAPLLAILSDHYGARLAISKFNETIALNEIRDPALVDAGLVLTVEVVE